MTQDFIPIYCFVDDFFKFLDQKISSINNSKTKTGPSPYLTRSEVLTIIIGYASSPHNCFKNYYISYVMRYHRQDFKLPSYAHFIKLISKHLSFLVILLHCILEKCDGTSFVDSTSIAVCKNYRIRSHKVFKGFAARSKTTKGWFFGLKLHAVINLDGSIVKAFFTPGNTDDRAALKSMTKNVFGKIFGDRGYISNELFKELFAGGIELVTAVRRNMKNKLMGWQDKMMLKKRALIETVFGKIKLLGKFEHSRHRSVTNAFSHMVAILINYELSNNKPSIRNSTVITP